MKIINPEDQPQKTREAWREMQNRKGFLNHRAAQIKQELMNLHLDFENSPRVLQFILGWLYKLQVKELELELEEVISEQKEIQAIEPGARAILNYFASQGR